MYYDKNAVRTNVGQYNRRYAIARYEYMRKSGQAIDIQDERRIADAALSILGALLVGVSILCLICSLWA